MLNFISINQQLAKHSKLTLRQAVLIAGLFASGREFEFINLEEDDQYKIVNYQLIIDKLPAVYSNFSQIDNDIRALGKKGVLNVEEHEDFLLFQFTKFFLSTEGY